MLTAHVCSYLLWTPKSLFMGELWNMGRYKEYLIFWFSAKGGALIDGTEYGAGSTFGVDKSKPFSLGTILNLGKNQTIKVSFLNWVDVWGVQWIYFFGLRDLWLVFLQVYNLQFV